MSILAEKLTQAGRQLIESLLPQDCLLCAAPSEDDGEIAGLYKTVARQVAVKIAARAKDFSAKFPSIKISKDT